MFLIGMRTVEAVFVFLSHQQYHRRNGYGPAYFSYTSTLSSSLSLWKTLLALVMASFLIHSSSPSTIQAAVDSSESDGSGREFQWQIITKRNFSSQIRLHPHILLMVTIPWSGESRSLMKEISQLVASKQKNFGGLKLMLLYRNKEMILADAINAAEEISILCYRHSLSYKYRGRLRAQNILSSVQFLMSHPPEQLPLESLNTPEELKAFLQSSDKALLLLEFCGWTGALLAKGKNNGTENSFDIPFGVGFTAETNKSVAAEGKKNQKGIEDEKMTCGVQNLVSGIPWVGEFSSVNDSDFEAKNTRPTVGISCSFDEFRQFDAFFSNLTAVAREFFLPPERLRFGLIPERSLLSSLHVGDSGSWLSSLDFEDSGSWLMILHSTGCPSCSKVLIDGDDIESALHMQNSPVIELGLDGHDTEPPLPANKPSVLLFIDRSSDSLKTRRKSKEAIDTFRNLALHYHTSHGISEQNNFKTDKTILDNYQALKSMPRDQRFKLSSTSRNVALEDKMSVLIVNKGEHVTLDKVASGLQGNSLQEILAYLLDQKNEVKLSSLAKEVGFQLLSEDLDIKVQEALPTQRKVLESDQVLPKPTEYLPEADVGLDNDQIPFIDSTSELKHEKQYKHTNSDKTSQSTEEKTYDRSRQLSGKPELLMASTSSLEQQEHYRPTDADQSSQYTEEETTSERSKQQSGKSGHFHGNQALGNAEKGKMDWKMLSQGSNFGKEKLHLKNFKGSFFFSDGGYQLLRALTAGSKIPSVVIVDPILQKHYVFPEGTVFSYFSLSDFLDGFLNGSLLSYQLSESVVRHLREAPRPPFVNSDFHEVDSIPRVTTRSFSELVIGFNPSDNLNGGHAWKEDVLVLFSNSWCGFCQRMELVVREVHRAFKHYSTMLTNESRNDRSVLPDGLKDIALKLPLIYLMDCTLNECSLIFRSLAQREHFPSLLLFPAERKNTIPYEGDVAVSDIIKFIIDYGSNARNLDKKGIWQNGVEQDSMKQNLHEDVSQLFIDKEAPLSKEKYHEVLLKYRIPERVVSYNQKRPHKSNGLNGARPQVVVGSLLVATEKLLTIHPFDKSTILIVKADEGTGFQGLIINKHISWDSLNELEEGLKLLTEARLSFGGPVLKQGMPFVALTRRTIKNHYTQILPNIYFLDQQATIHEIEALKLHNHSVFDYWFFLGYSIWGWDQLFDEISLGAWNISSGNIEQLDWPWR